MPQASSEPRRWSVGAAPLVAIGVAVTGALFAGFVAWINAVPFVPGFDDAEHLRAAVIWRDEWRLSGDGLFVRVPLWQILLGSLFAVARPGVAIAALQLGCVIATLAAALVFARRAGHDRPLLALAIPPLLLALSPQALLYARHPVNELLIGALAAWILALGVRAGRREALGMGLAVGVATMTKLSMGLLLVPALAFAWRGAAAERGARTLRLALGVGLVVVPLLTLHFVQRGDLPLDNTSAYTLGEYMPEAWIALGDPEQRRQAGMASFRRQVAEDPGGYAVDTLTRLRRWVTRPATADFALFVPDFPKRAVGLWEHAVLLALLALAAYGTTRATAAFWIFIVALPLLCAVPVHVPFVPKIVPAFACLPLACAGIARLLAKPR